MIPFQSGPPLPPEQLPDLTPEIQEYGIFLP